MDRSTAVALGVLGLVLAIYVAHPQIKIAPGASSPANGVIPFDIKNDGALSLFGVTATCLLDEVRYEDNVVERHDTITQGRGPVALDREGAMTIACGGFTRDVPIERADMTLSVEFSTRFWPRQLKMQQRFVVARSDGTFRWWLSVPETRYY